MTDIRTGDCLEVLRTMPDNSVDAVVTDPPYGLSFMGKKWDYDVPSVEIWAECLRVLKPGGHLLTFAGTRTQHRMAVRIEDAGFEIRDMIAWVYGSGFPKSLDVSKAIDKAAGAEREVIGSGKGRTGAAAQPNGGSSFSDDSYQWPGDYDITAPATDAARQWQGWGTALKPAMEPITVARKPLDGTVADNVLRHGTGAINVDGCRVVMGDEYDPSKIQRQSSVSGSCWSSMQSGIVGKEIPTYKPGGRWPANLIHDGSDEATGLLDSAARFFYCPKASKSDRDEGLDGVARKSPAVESAHSVVCAKCNRQRVNVSGACKCESPEWVRVQQTPRANHHPTVKPTDLMRYLCRLVTHTGGVVLDPFCGSGSTGKAAMLEGFHFIGIDREEAYCEVAAKRIQSAERECAESLVPA